MSSSPRAAADPSASLKELLRQVRRIELRTQWVVSDLAAGRYRSAFRGLGLEFEEVREYSTGDDVRNIDWNVTARAGRPFVKVFREERELTTMMLVDGSGSMRFGAIDGMSTRTKLGLATEAAAIVAVSALRNNDRIGLMVFSDRTDVHLPPRKGRSHVMRLLRAVLGAGVEHRRTDLAGALDELGRVAAKRTVCFLASDFMDIGEGFGGALARAARRHDVVGLRIEDPAERTLPQGSAPMRLVDPETGEIGVFANGRRARAEYAARYQAHRQRTLELFHTAGCDLVELSTGDGAAIALERFFRGRRKRIHV